MTVAATGPAGVGTWWSIVVALAGALVAITGIGWRYLTSTLKDERTERQRAQADLRELEKIVREELVPELTRSRDLTTRALEVLARVKET